MSLAANQQIDRIQQRLVDYAGGIAFDALPAQVVHQAKARVIDNLGVLSGGFFTDSAQIARGIAAAMPGNATTTVLGTRMKTTPDVAAFANATGARGADMADAYHWPGSYQGHPSDLVTPLLGVAEHVHASGRDYIASLVLAYEVFCRLCDVFRSRAFDNTNFACVAAAIGAGKLMRLTPAALSHCISMAVVPNNALRQVRLGHTSMWKSVASGHAARAGVFAAMLAQAGMEGPHLPFEGKAGWCDHIAGERFSLDALGGDSIRFKILDTRIKIRPANANTIASILAAEKIAPLRDLANVKSVLVEVYEEAYEGKASAEHHWHPDSRETANQSAPYNVAAALIDGTITLRSFDDAHLKNPQLRALLKKIQFRESAEFTKAYHRVPIEHRARITVTMNDGEKIVAEAGGDHDDLSAPRSDAQIEAKFRSLTEDAFGAKHADALLRRLWQLENEKDLAEIPPILVIG